jgi:site-specific DNA recombinase
MGPRASVYARQSSNKTKSINEQLAAGQQVVTDQGWTLASSYSDGSSASRYAKTIRGGWEAVIADLKQGTFDVLVLWEASRGDRTPETWLAFLSVCRKNKVSIHVITDDHTYNLSRARDWKTLANAGVDSAYETELLSIRVKRGHAGAAASGRPSMGLAPYGYRRVYDPMTGKLTGQQPHEPEATIVREVITRVSQGEAISSIANDLNRRGVPTGAQGWYRARVRSMATNRAYVALRVLNGTTFKGEWEAIADEATFYAAQRVLEAPGRKVSRPGRQKHLLSYLASSPCGGLLCVVRNTYRCSADSCVSASKGAMDLIVTDMVIARLSQPDAYEVLAHSDDEAVKRAQGQIHELKNRLDEWRASAAKGETSPASLAVIESELEQQITTAEDQVVRSSVPPALQDMLSPGTDVRERWEAASLPARRAVIRAVAEVRLAKASRRGLGGQELQRLGGSSWVGDAKTWADYWD